MAKLIDLLNLGFVKRIDDNKYECLDCGKIYTKGGVCNHHFYEHSNPEAKEKLREISTINNNKPEMKELIGRRTKEELNSPEIREKFLEIMGSEEMSVKLSERSKKNWEDDDYREKTTKGIRESRTPEFSENLGKIMKVVLNDPNSKVQSDEYAKECSERVTELWKTDEFRNKVVQSQNERWTDELREETSLRMKKQWHDEEFCNNNLEGQIKRVSEGEIKTKFGYRGLTENGTYYMSLLEKEVFEFLENNKIEFKHHVKIPESGRNCDILILDTWVELDGLDRDKKDEDSIYGWRGKLEIFESLKKEKKIKDYKIFKTAKDFICWISGELSNDKTI